MDDIALVRSIVARFKVADSFGDPKTLLREFEQALQEASILPTLLIPAREFFERRVKEGPAPGASSVDDAKQISHHSDTAYRAYFRFTKYNRMMAPGYKLFLTLIQSINLPPALRKKVEVASRMYLKVPSPRFKAKSGPARYLEMIQGYDKYMETAYAHLELAKAAIAQGKAHSEEGENATKLKVGPFTLVNTGGFPAKQMDEIAEIVRKATALAQASGLGEVCYGDMQVTNTIHKSNVLAFYTPANDEFFIRANVKSDSDTLHTVLHELGHRYESKFLKRPKGAEILYQTLKGEERHRQFKELKKPEPGDTIVVKGKTLVVDRVTFGRGLSGYRVELHVEGDPKRKMTTPLETFLEFKGDGRTVENDPEFIGFVTNYAKKSPSENFAEMFAFYCLDKLPVKQSVPFEEVVFGTGKTADSRLAERMTVKQLLKF